MRVPCATMALETTESEPGTLQAEVASTMAICGSIITNLIATTAAVLVGSAVVSVLPDVIVSALTKYAAGAIFGGTFGTYALKYPKVAILVWDFRLSLNLRSLLRHGYLSLCLYSEALDLQDCYM